MTVPQPWRPKASLNPMLASVSPETEGTYVLPLRILEYRSTMDMAVPWTVSRATEEKA